MPNEYIERETALRAILGQPPDAHYPGWYADSIKEIPAADVVPVVRCKDCKHYSRLGSCLIHSEIADEYSTGFDFRMDDNDFCSYGEKKEEQ